MKNHKSLCRRLNCNQNHISKRFHQQQLDDQTFIKYSYIFYKSTAIWIKTTSHGGKQIQYDSIFIVDTGPSFKALKRARIGQHLDKYVYIFIIFRDRVAGSSRVVTGRYRGSARRGAAGRGAVRHNSRSLLRYSATDLLIPPSIRALVRGRPFYLSVGSPCKL